MERQSRGEMTNIEIINVVLRGLIGTHGESCDRGNGCQAISEGNVALAALEEIEREQKQANWTRDLAQSASTRDLEAKRVAEREFAAARALIEKAAKGVAGWNEHSALHAELRAFLEPPAHPDSDPRKACVVEEPAGGFWLIHFEDDEMPVEIFTNKAAASERYHACQLNWTCHLFEMIAPKEPVESKPAECGCAARKALQLAIMTVECASIDTAKGSPTEGDELPWYRAARAALATPCECQGMRGIFRYTCGHYRGPGSEAGACVVCAELAAALEREREAVGIVQMLVNSENTLENWEAAEEFVAAFDARKEG